MGFVLVQINPHPRTNMVLTDRGYKRCAFYFRDRSVTAGRSRLSHAELSSYTPSRNQAFCEIDIVIPIKVLALHYDLRTLGHSSALSKTACQYPGAGLAGGRFSQN